MSNKILLAWILVGVILMNFCMVELQAQSEDPDLCAQMRARIMELEKAKYYLQKSKQSRVNRHIGEQIRDNTGTPTYSAYERQARSDRLQADLNSMQSRMNKLEEDCNALRQYYQNLGCQ